MAITFPWHVFMASISSPSHGLCSRSKNPASPFQQRRKKSAPVVVSIRSLFISLKNLLPNVSGMNKGTLLDAVWTRSLTYLQMEQIISITEHDFCAQ